MAASLCRLEAVPEKGSRQSLQSVVWRNNTLSVVLQKGSDMPQAENCRRHSVLPHPACPYLSPFCKFSNLGMSEQFPINANVCSPDSRLLAAKRHKFWAKRHSLLFCTSSVEDVFNELM